MQLGLLVGAITGAVVGFVIFRFPPEGLSFPIGAILAFVLLGAMFGIWVSGMIGSGAPNSQLKEFEKSIAAGKILIMVDVPREKISEVRGIMKKRHPEADDRGIEPTIPAFP